MKIRKRTAFLVFLMVYVGSYAALSINGNYYPATIGLQGEKVFNWSPAGFSSKKEYRWNHTMILLYLPLWEVDRFWIHPIDFGNTARPIIRLKNLKPRNKNEPNKAVELSRLLVTDAANAASAPSNRLAHFGR